MWAGRVNLEAGGRLVAVEYDTAATAAAIRARCRRWLSDDERDVPAAFGVRGARVGFRRRTVGVVHHGAPVRHRLPSLDAAVDAVATIVEGIERRHAVGPGRVAVDARVFVGDRRAVLFHAPLSVDVDERRLARAGVEDVPAWRPVIDIDRRSVAVGDRSWPLAGFVLAGYGRLDLDAARGRVWHLGERPGLDWAELVDDLGDRVVVTADDPPEAIDDLLRRR